MSRARKQFNTLIKKLETARSLVTMWKDTLPVVVSRADNEYWPLTGLHDERLKQLVVLLDGMHGTATLGKRERDKLSKFVAITALDLLNGEDDEVLKEIYERHSGEDLDADDDANDADIKAMMEALLGAGFENDIGADSPAAMRAAFQALHGEPDGATEAAGHQEAPRPKRPADLARERRQAAEAQRLQQSMREIFRKLASQLHPDRETDEAERQRKTALMQRVNVAYAANDMLGLLELQLEVEQIDQASLANLADDRIKQYNKVLSGQLAELESEVDGFVATAALIMGAGIFDVLTPATVRDLLDSDIARVQRDIAELDEDLQSLHDVKKLKAWLKALPKSALQQDDDVFW